MARWLPQWAASGPGLRTRSINTTHSALATTPASGLLLATHSAPTHAKAGHPESPERITVIERTLSADSRLRSLQRLPPPSGGWDAPRVRAALELVHPPQYLDRLAQICSGLQAPTMIDDSTYVCPGSFKECCEAVAVVLQAADAVLSVPAVGGTVLPALCLVRPPGHHVLPTRPMGFGLINTVSVATLAALHAGSWQPSTHTHRVQRVLLVDFDVHHGNGTEEVMWRRSDVLYISMHQSGLWPYTGKVRSAGAGDGEGTTINVPLPGDSGHQAALMVFDAVIAPAARRFSPDVIIVSAGFDAHALDPLAGLSFEGATYHALTTALTALAHELCGGRVLYVLEGGYHLDSLAVSVADAAAGVVGEEAAAPSGGRGLHLQPEPLSKVEAVLLEVTRLHGL